MVRVQVPTSLYGASLGKANAWVREQIAFSNPHKPMGDYKLHDDSGRSVSLSALTNGDLDAVNISGVMDTVRINPAHPADLQGFAHSPAPMFSSNLTRFIPDKVTVSMWESAVSEYGAFGATQFLSRLLTEELKGHNMPDPYVQDLLNARRLHVGAPMEKVRLNPTRGEVENAVAGLDLGPYQRAQSQLGKGKMLGIQSKMLDEKVQAYINDLLDDTEVAFKKDKDHGAFMSVANKFSIRYENSKALFEDFAMNVFSPYLVASSANLYALQYINEYVLPTLRTAIENQKDFSRWFIRKGSGRGSGKEAALRELDRQYRHIVKTLATAPSDYYYGKELALIANPAYLFKHVGLVMLPLPQFPAAGKMKKADGERLERLAALFIQAGNPPEYNKEGGLRVINPSWGPKQPVVEYLGRDLYRSTLKEAEDRKKHFALFKEAIHTLAQRVERREGAYSSHALVTTANAMAHKSLKDLYEDVHDYPSLYYLDLIGIRPIPTNWPEKLIFAMMEVTASYRDRISGLGKDFNFTDFLTPTGIMMTGSAVTYTSKGLRNEKEIKDEIKKMKESGQNSRGAYDKDKWSKVVEEHARFLESVATTYELATGSKPSGIGALTALAAYNIDKTSEAKKKALHSSLLSGRANLVNLFLGAANTSPFGYKDMGDSPSVYKIIGESVKLSIRKYGYEPSGDDVKFVTLLLYFCLRNMKLDKEISNGFMAEMLEAFEEARKGTFDDAYTKFETKIDDFDTSLGGDLSRLIALMAAKETLLESRHGKSDVVLTNPGTVMTLEDSDLMLKKLDELIKAEKTRLEGPGGLSDLDEIADFAKTLFDTEIMEKIKTSDFNPVVLGSGVNETKDNMRELIDRMANTINQQVGELIAQATDFFPLLDKEEEKTRASTITGSLNALKATLDLYQNIGTLTSSLTSDFVRGSDAYEAEQEYFFALNAYASQVGRMFDDLIKDAEKATEKHLKKEDKWGIEFSGYERVLVKLVELSSYVIEAEEKAFDEAEELNAIETNHYSLSGYWDDTEYTLLEAAFKEWVDAKIHRVKKRAEQAEGELDNIDIWAPLAKDEDGKELYPNYHGSWGRSVKESHLSDFRSATDLPSFASVLAKGMKVRNAPSQVVYYMERHYDGLKAKLDKALMNLQKDYDRGVKRDERKVKRAERVDAVKGTLKAVKDKSVEKTVEISKKGLEAAKATSAGTRATAGLGTAGTALGLAGGAGVTAATAPAVLGAVGIVAAVKGFQGLIDQTQKATAKNKAKLEEMEARAKITGEELGRDNARRLLKDAEAAKNDSLKKIREAEEAIRETERIREQNQMDTEAEKGLLEREFVSALRDLEDQRAIIMADYDRAVDFANSIVEGTTVQISQFDAKKITSNTYDDFEGALTYALMALPEDQHEAVKDEAKAMKATMISKLRAAGETEQAQKFEDLDVEAF